MDPVSLFGEFKRRRVFRALVGYGIAAFAVLQIVEPIAHGVHWPDAVLSYVVVALAAGFPVVVALAWIFDVSAGRIERAPAAGLRGLPLAAVLIAIGAVAAAPGLLYFFVVRSPARTMSAPASIAVLPFVNMSSDKEGDYFSDGITEELINALANVKGLHVVSRTSAFSFKGRNVSVRTIGEELAVATVVEGSVRREGSAVRITAQLVNAADGYHLWSQTYDRELQSVFMIEDDLARSIVQALRPMLMKASSPLVREATASIEAHDLYLRGRHFASKRTAQGLKRAVELFQQALDVDSSYALAHVGLADATLLLIEYGKAPLADSLRKAKAHAQRALELDRDLGEAHASLGGISTDEYDWKEAERQYRRAIESRPGYATAHHWYALLLLRSGRFAEGRAEAQRAQQLDPVSLIINNLIALASLYSRDYPRAIEEYTRALEMEPTFRLFRQGLLWAYFHSERYAEALAELDKMGENGPDEIATRARILLASGDRAAATALLKGLETRSTTPAISSLSLASIYIALGDKEQGLALLEKAYDNRDSICAN